MCVLSRLVQVTTLSLRRRHDVKLASISHAHEGAPASIRVCNNLSGSLGRSLRRRSCSAHQRFSLHKTTSLLYVPSCFTMILTGVSIQFSLCEHDMRTIQYGIHSTRVMSTPCLMSIRRLFAVCMSAVFVQTSMAPHVYVQKCLLRRTVYYSPLHPVCRGPSCTSIYAVFAI